MDAIARWQKALLLAGGAAATAGLLWYLLREGQDQEEEQAAEAQEGQGKAAPGLWQATDAGGKPIGIREGPDLSSPRTGKAIRPGQVFEVVEVVQGEGEQTYLRLTDDRGWVFTNSGHDGRLLARPLAPGESPAMPPMPPGRGMEEMMQEAQREMAANPELMQQFMSDPAVRAMMANPEQMAQTLGMHPTMGEGLGDPNAMAAAFTQQLQQASALD